jgi:polyketide synthase-like dehydratase family protein
MRHPLEIEVRPYIYDHQVEGRCVFPAVEALIVLARNVQSIFPQARTDCLLKVRFSRFLQVSSERGTLSVFVDVEKTDQGGLAARMMTSVRSKIAGIGRTLEHARVEFLVGDPFQNPVTTWPDPEKPEGHSLTIPASAIYLELIPFGPAFQNIMGPVSVWPQGALAALSGGGSEADDALLGSPFPLDAAFQLACVWGQCFTEYVLFPVGFEKRIIHRKTKKGGLYQGRIRPVAVDRQPFVFDALIHDAHDILYEEIRGIQMRDGSQGRRLPPLWIKEKLESLHL